MVHHNADKSDYILIEDFLDKLTCWRTSKEFNKALDKHIDININNLRDQSVPFSAKRSDLESSKESEIPKKTFPNKSKKYLKIAKKRQEEEENSLKMNVDKCKKELEFDCLHKMSEAWEIAKLLNIPITFSASKGSDGSILIHMIEISTQKRKEKGEDGEIDEDEGEGDSSVIK